MGKASSAKKVAQAARAGGRASGVRQRNLLFPAVMVGIVAAGTGLVYYARSEHQNASVNVAPSIGDHWHAAYGVYICDGFVSATDGGEMRKGIHSHADDLIHIHPSSKAASGERAQMKVFFEDAPTLDIDSDRIEVGDQTWRAGEDTCEVDGEEVEAEIVLAQWDDVLGDSDYALRTNIPDERFRQDGEGYVFAFVPVGETGDIPKPPSLDTLAEVSGRPLQSQIDPDEIDPDDLPDDVDIEDLDELFGGDDPGAGGQPLEPAGPVAPEADPDG